MAKLGSFYSLCPLIDNKNLLNISEDPEEGVVIVTLGKNIASRYRISDQKQLTCWRTKDKFSSPVIYHKNRAKYIAVFNQSHIKLWDADDNLDKLKKYKFTKPIHSILEVNYNYFILFQNGSIHNFDEAIEERKTLTPSGIDIKQIDDVLHTEVNGNIYIGLKSESNFFWTKYNEGNCKYLKIELCRDDLILNGYVFHTMRNIAYLLTFWSDGSIFFQPLEESDLSKKIGELFTVVDCVSPKHFVSMLSLDENYIALYGANNNEEGAMLALYNVQFKVTQSKQPFKLFSKNYKIWKQLNTILLPVGQNLAVVPFHLETEQLAALVGSHKELQSGLDPDIKIVHELDIASWDGRSIKKSLPENLKEKMEQFVKQGLSENTILEELLPEIFKQNDTNLLFLILVNFTDIPEKYLVNILNYSLDINKNTKLINTILRRSFSEVLILPHLRSNLSTDKVLALLKHIQTIWTENKTLQGLNYVDTHAKFLEWSCVLIDANYQKIVLSKDKAFSETLTEINELVKTSLEYLEDLKTIEPLLNSIKNNKVVSKCSNVANLRYSVEQISLY